MSKTAYWDAATQSTLERDCTPEEEADIAARLASAPAQQAEAQRISDIDDDIAADAQIAAGKTMTIAQLNAFWTGRTAAQKDAIIKRLFIVLLRRVL